MPCSSLKQARPAASWQAGRRSAWGRAALKLQASGTQVFLDGRRAGYVERNFPQNLSLAVPPGVRRAGVGADAAKLSILVEAMGRVNFGCVWDFKGLQSPQVRLNGEPCHCHSAVRAPGRSAPGCCRNSSCSHCRWLSGLPALSLSAANGRLQGAVAAWGVAEPAAQRKQLTPSSTGESKQGTRPSTPDSTPCCSGQVLQGWTVWPMFVEDLSRVAWQDTGAELVSGRRQQQQEAGSRLQRAQHAATLALEGPKFYRRACIASEGRHWQ